MGRMAVAGHSLDCGIQTGGVCGCPTGIAINRERYEAAQEKIRAMGLETPPSRADLSAISALMALMRQNGATRVRCERIEVELAPLAAGGCSCAAIHEGPCRPARVTPASLMPPPQAEPAIEGLGDDEPKVCTCGHLWVDEHGPAGCLRGCHLGSCGAPTNWDMPPPPPPEAKGPTP